MGQPIAVRTDFTALEVRRLARRAKDSDQVWRQLRNQTADKCLSDAKLYEGAGMPMIE